MIVYTYYYDNFTAMIMTMTISEQRRHTNIRVARSQKGKTKQWPELGIGKVS